MSKRHPNINIQSEMIQACCDAEGWDYQESLDSFEPFYQANKSKLTGGLREAVTQWYNIRRKGSLF